jgi:hypothetical protein
MGSFAGTLDLNVSLSLRSDIPYSLIDTPREAAAAKANAASFSFVGWNAQMPVSDNPVSHAVARYPRARPPFDSAVAGMKASIHVERDGGT